METEMIFLDVNYIENRLQEFKKIRTQEISYKIQKSVKKNSNTIYVNFYIMSPNNNWSKTFTVRISDHYVKTIHPTFLVKRNAKVTSKRKQSFMDTLQRAINYTSVKHCKYLMKRVNHELNNLQKSLENFF